MNELEDVTKKLDFLPLIYKKMIVKQVIFGCAAAVLLGLMFSIHTGVSLLAGVMPVVLGVLVASPIANKKNKGNHFSSSEELREFYEDGVEILKTFKRKKGQYFNKKGWYLVGCEIPIITKPNKFYNNVIYQGYLDIVMYHEPTQTFKIIDIKTSTRGWNDKVKKDEDKQFQLILYKKFFAEQFNVPISNIDIEFFILKRKVYDHPDFVIPRIQTFTPASGKVKLNKADKALNSFIEEVFDKNGYKDKNYTPTPSKWNCTFCPFKDNPELCSAAE